MSDKPAGSPRVDWRAANLRNVSFAGVSLEGADLRAADLSGSNFTAANLRYADLRGATLVGTTFQNADLYGAKMQGVEAYQADFRGADLRQANFGGAYLDGAMLPPPSPADLVERSGGAAPQRQDRPEPPGDNGAPAQADRQQQPERSPQSHGQRQARNRVKV